MKRINFTMSITCTDDKFESPQVKNMLSDKWKDELIESANKSGLDNVTANWEVEEVE